MLFPSFLVKAKEQSLGGPIGGFDAYNPGAAGEAEYLSSAELLISNVLTVLTIVGGIMFSLYFLLGGLTWITAGGKSEKIEKAKGMMTNGAIGIIVIAVSYSIVWIIGKVVGIDILTPGQTLQDTIKF
jgi:cytochrome bd-type quinol oxidase subunit 2